MENAIKGMRFEPVAILIRLKFCPDPADDLVPYSQVFCLEKQENCHATKVESTL